MTSRVKSRPLVLHAPSDRRIKGTRYILKAVERLQAEGAQFDFSLVENLTHAQARQRYDDADLLIDQLLVGWYGGLAVELMAMGKPVMCYLRPGDMKFLPQEMREQIPIIQATPDTIYNVLKDWLSLPREAWQGRGLESRNYVETWHDPLKIAERLKRDYEAALSRARA